MQTNTLAATSVFGEDMCINSLGLEQNILNLIRIPLKFVPSNVTDNINIDWANGSAKNRRHATIATNDGTVPRVWHLRDTVSWKKMLAWWRHQMETFSALLALCAGNSPVTGEFPTQRPVTRSFGVFFDLGLNKRLSQQSWSWWFETPSRSLWRHSIVFGYKYLWSVFFIVTTDYNCALVFVLVWCQTGDKSASVPMMTQLSQTGLDKLNVMPMLVFCHSILFCTIGQSNLRPIPICLGRSGLVMRLTSLLSSCIT